MFRLGQHLGPVLGVTLALLSAAPARADVPPPAGRKRVDFSFVVKGVAAAPDRVLFAYPCGDSNGAPIAEYKKIEEGKPVSIGRRGGDCPIYSVAKTTYDAWAKNYRPTGSVKDDALEKLASESKKCTGGPTPVYEVASSDSRTSVEQTLNVTTLNATDCVLTAAAIASPASTTPSATPPSTSSSAPSSPAKSSSCAASPGSGGGLAFAAAVACIAGIVAERRRRR
jgi:hypothetical protein